MAFFSHTYLGYLKWPKWQVAHDYKWLGPHASSFQLSSAMDGLLFLLFFFLFSIWISYDKSTLIYLLIGLSVKRVKPQSDKTIYVFAYAMIDNIGSDIANFFVWEVWTLRKLGRCQDKSPLDAGQAPNPLRLNPSLNQLPFINFKCMRRQVLSFSSNLRAIMFPRFFFSVMVWILYNSN